MLNYMTKFCEQITTYITKPTNGKAKSTNTIATYRNSFSKLLKLTGLSEEELVAGSFDAGMFVQKIKDAKLADATQLKLAKLAQSFLEYVGIKKIELTEYVDELAGAERLARGQIRSEEEHELHYVDTDGKQEVLEEEIRQYLESGSTDERRRLTLLAMYLMLMVPLRPEEAVSIGKVKEGFDNYIDSDTKQLVITKQKSMAVGTRKIDLPELFLQLAYVDCKSKFLFPSLRSGEQHVMDRHDYTEQLIKEGTLEFLDKSVSSRALRKSVISNKVVKMTPGEQVKFAKRCGHHHTTQIDHYAVLQKEVGVPPILDVVPTVAPLIKPKITIKQCIPQVVPVTVVPPKIGQLSQRSYRDGEFILEDIPFSKLKEISQLVTAEQIKEVSFRQKSECYISLRNISLPLSIQIEELFEVGNQGSP